MGCLSRRFDADAYRDEPWRGRGVHVLWAVGPAVRFTNHRLTSVAIFGVGTLATTGVWDVMSLSVVRFVSAIGLGGAIPVAVAAATDVVVTRHKETATMLVTSGVSAGAVVGGVIGGPLTRDYGWQAIFIVGGVLPLILLPLFARMLKQNSQLLARSGGAKTNSSMVGQLFMQGLGARTGFLWLFSFLIFLLMYAMAFWVPTLLVEFGFAREQAALGAAAFGMGGLIGNIVMMSLVAIVGVKRLLALTTLLAMACVLTISKAEISGTFVLVMIAGLGAGLVTGGVGQSALAVSLYPHSRGRLASAGRWRLDAPVRSWGPQLAAFCSRSIGQRAISS